MRKTVTILGSTGSIGVNALRVIEEHPKDFKVEGLAAGSQLGALKEQIYIFSPSSVYLRDPAAALELGKIYGKKLKIFSEKEGLKEFSSKLDSDILLAATSGTSALLPVLDALDKGRRVALANKEILVMAGKLVMEKLRGSHKASLVPVDSEHNAIFQCLQGSHEKCIEKIILTGSGGPLRDISEEQFASLTKEVVTHHPRWKMGKKISVDSATMMNKGLEIIEAAWLFDIPIDRIQVLIHPEAVIHSMVQFIDGAVLAQLGVTDMRLPIQHALSFPERLSSSASMKLDFSKISNLTFSLPNRKKFPCLEIAYQAAVRSGSDPCVLSAADEVAVIAYLDDQIEFQEIPYIIEKVLSSHRHVANPDLTQIQSIHRWAVEETKKLC
ncbi:MAG: 1-deoxy-D-xylulose-5-phosphate reductoisomerase [Candidatus Omnitrophica bacterium CG1_02_49_16]|nr:MAG: 1-deoxy-D-xylulose-5-phosphate reductoisomerase [Candidatus Omnitrophica bacterium CG1_02_49_16]